MRWSGNLSALPRDRFFCSGLLLPPARAFDGVEARKRPADSATGTVHGSVNDLTPNGNNRESPGLRVPSFRVENPSPFVDIGPPKVFVFEMSRKWPRNASVHSSSMAKGRSRTRFTAGPCWPPAESHEGVGVRSEHSVTTPVVRKTALKPSKLLPVGPCTTYFLPSNLTDDVGARAGLTKGRTAVNLIAFSNSLPMVLLTCINLESDTQTLARSPCPPRNRLSPNTRSYEPS
jgi:hypothetical protein